MRLLEEKIAQQLSGDIDSELTATVLTTIGWTKVKLNYNIITPRSREDWCDEYCIGQYKHLGYNWLFERAEDAVMFKLTWWL